MAVWASFPTIVLGQITPVYLTDMNLSALLSMKVARPPADSGYSLVKQQGRWHFLYQYVRKAFEGYRDGARRISNEAVLWQQSTIPSDLAGG